MNRDCRHFNCPADGLCKVGWTYTKGEKWEVDNTIALECKGTLNNFTQCSKIFTFNVKQGKLKQTY